MWIYIHIKDSCFCGFGAYIWIFRVQIFMRRRNRRWGWLSPSTFSIILILHTYTYGKQRKERKSWKWKSGQLLIFWEKKQTRNISHDIFVCMIYVDVHWRACMDGFYSLSLHDRQLCSSNNEICNGWLSPCSTTDIRSGWYLWHIKHSCGQWRAKALLKDEQSTEKKIIIIINMTKQKSSS